MTDIIAYVGAHWVEWLIALLTAAFGLGYKNITARLRAEQEKNAAIAAGVESLLRDAIVNAYNKYSDKGFCPIYAKESIKKAYAAYHDLGGNDIATSLYHKVLAMPEEEKDEAYK